MVDEWVKKMWKEGNVTTDLVKVLICQPQDSKCPKCGKVTHRLGFTTDEQTIFGCGQGHDFITWYVQPKELSVPECDLVGLLSAWHYGNITECRKVVRTGSMLTVADKETKETKQ